MDNWKIVNESLKNSGSRKVLVEFRRPPSLVFSAVMCFSQSRFLYEGVSESRFFARSRSPDSFVRFLRMTSSHHLILNFNEATFNFREKFKS